MQNLICPYGATLARDTFGCRHAERIIRRGGTEFSCRDPEAHARCLLLFGRLKDVALAAFAVEDDLTQMPHSVLVKIQFGGLLGLQHITQTSPPGSGRIEDIDSLVRAAIMRFGDLQAIPCELLGADMTAYTLSRRSRR
ncbi:MAG: hypothetical protein PVI50_00680 [Gammaproteobacteria bacterium]|jgi:hypothetical protein